MRAADPMRISRAGPASERDRRRPNRSKVSMRPEHPWRIVASTAASSIACVVGLMCWWQAAPDYGSSLPSRPRVRSGRWGLAGYLVVGVFGSFIGWLLVGLVGTLSKRPAAAVAAALAVIAVLLPL